MLQNVFGLVWLTISRTGPDILSLNDTESVSRSTYISTTDLYDIFSTISHDCIVSVGLSMVKER